MLLPLTSMLIAYASSLRVSQIDSEPGLDAVVGGHQIDETVVIHHADAVKHLVGDATCRGVGAEHTDGAVGQCRAYRIADPAAVEGAVDAILDQQDGRARLGYAQAA